MDWVSCVLTLFLLVRSATSCAVLKDGKPLSDGDLPFQQVTVKDTQQPGVTLLQYQTDDISEVNGNDEFIDVEFDKGEKTITVTLKEAFTHYEENNTISTRTTSNTIICSNGDQLTPLGITVTIEDTDNHDPKFNQTDVTFTLPMPYPAGLQIGTDNDIWAYDFDLTSDLEISTDGISEISKQLEVKTVEMTTKPDWPEHSGKKFYAAKITTKAQVDITEDSTFNLIVKDKKHSEKVSRLPVTIRRDSSTSIPNSPIFKAPLYETEVNYEMEQNTKLVMKPGDIAVDNFYGSLTVVSMEGDHKKYFSMKTTKEGLVNIFLKEQIDDHDIRYALLTLEAKTKNATYSGFAIIYVAFPSAVCPTTTTAEPVTCPEVTCSTEPECTCPTPPECTCPTETETTCPTPPECTCPTPPECTCPTTTETTCPTPPECTCPTPIEITCPTPHECTCPTQTEVTCPTPVECTCPTQTEVTCPTPPECTCPTPTETTCPTPPECTCPTQTEVSCPTPTETTCPTPAECTCPTQTEVTCPTPTETTCPTPVECTCPTQTEVTCPTPTETTCPTPAECTCPTTPECTCPTPTDVTCPTPTETTSPTPAECTCPTPPECTCPTPTETTCPTPPECTCPTPTEITCATPPECTCPTPTDITCPTPPECTCPTQTEVTCPTPTETTCPTPVECTCSTPPECTCPTQTEVTCPTPVECTCPTQTEVTCPTPPECTCPTQTEVTCPTPTETTCPTPAECTCPTPPECTCPTPTETTCPTPPECTCPTPTEITCATPPECTCPTPTDITCPTPPECTCPTQTEVSCPTPTETTCPTPPECTCPTQTEVTCPTPTETTCPTPVECTCSTPPECTCPTQTEVTCPSPTEVTCPTPTETTCPTPPECTCPTQTEVTCPTPTETTCPTPVECTCPTQTEVTCPTPNETTCPTPPECTCPTPTEITCPALTETTCPTPVECTCSTPPECTCPTQTEVTCPTPPECTCPTQTEVTCPSPTETTCPTPVECTCSTPPECTCPTQTEVTCPTPTEVTCPTPTEITCPTPTNTTCPTPPECTCPTPTEITCPTSPECTCPTPTEVTCPTQTDITCPTPPECTCPTQTEVTCPTPTEVTCPTPTEITCPTPTNTTCSTPPECTCPTPTEITCPTSPECTCPTPTEVTCPTPTEITCPTPRECTCPTVTDVHGPTTMEVTSCPPCECTTPFWTTKQTTTTRVTTENECSCPTCPEVTHTTQPETNITTAASTEPGTTIDPCSLCPTKPETTCPTQNTEPTCPPPPECTCSTVHSGPTEVTHTTQPETNITTAASTEPGTTIDPCSLCPTKPETTCPTQNTEPTCPPPPECTCSTVHSVPTEVTYTPSGETSEHWNSTNQSTSTSEMSSSTQETTCTPCPEVTCPTSVSTTEVTNADSSHSESPWSTIQTKPSSLSSSGTTITTEYHTDVTGITSGSTGHGWDSTTKMSSSSNQMSSLSTRDLHSSTQFFTCPTCPECPGMTTTLGPPPSNPYLKFPVPSFMQNIKADYIGHITWTVAQPYPPDLTNWGIIDYDLEGLPSDLDNAVEITSSGELVAVSNIKAGDYSFNVTAEIKGITNKAIAEFYLIVSVMEFCENNTEVEGIFLVSFVSKTIKENEMFIFKTIDVPEGVSCNLAIIKETPTQGKFSIKNFKKEIVIELLPVDREDTIFGGAVIPEIQAEMNATCVKENASTASPLFKKNEQDWSTGHSSLTILIRVEDVDDSPPKFNTDKMTVGYPEKSIADEERPLYMGIAVAEDKDIGKNAEVTYSVGDTNEVIIDSTSGHFYPHPKYFDYKNTSFTIIATDKANHIGTIGVLVKILTPSDIMIIGIEGATVEQVPMIIKTISEKTNLQIGVISARMEGVNERGYKSSLGLLSQEHMIHQSQLLGTGKISRNVTHTEVKNKDDSIYLRLVIYALNASEPVTINQFNSSFSNIGNAKDWNLKRYAAEGGTTDKYSDSQSTGLTAAVIAVSTVLGLLLLGMFGFVLYRRRRGLKSRVGDSVETGIVADNASQNGDNDGFHEEGSVVFSSDVSSVRSEPVADASNVSEVEPVSPERRKSVAFAEEPEVIPSEEELEGSRTEVGQESAPDGENEDNERL